MQRWFFVVFLFTSIFPFLGYGSKVWIWELEGNLLHPRVWEENLYISSWDGYLYKTQDKRIFNVWNFKKPLNGIAPVGDKVYGVFGGSHPYMLDTRNNILYEWEHDVSYHHAYYDGLSVFFVGSSGDKGGIGVIEGEEHAFIDLSFLGITVVKDLISYHNENSRVLVFSAVTKQGGGMGFLYYDNMSVVFYPLPDIFGSFVDPNGLFFGENKSDILMAIMGSDKNTSFVRWIDGKYYVYPYPEHQLHVKKFGDYYLISLLNGKTVVYLPGESYFVYDSQPLKGRASKTILGKYTSKREVVPQKIEVQPKLVELNKYYDAHINSYVYDTRKVHDFAYGYAAGEVLYYLSDLIPRVYLEYDYNTKVLRSWIEPSDVFRDAIYVYVNDQLLISGKNISLKVYFMEGIYNVSAIYYDGINIYENTTIIYGDEKLRILERTIYDVGDNEKIFYARLNVAGYPLKIGNGVYWSDDEGEIIIPLKDANTLNTFLMRNSWYLVAFALFLLGSIVWFAFLRRFIKPLTLKYGVGVALLIISLVCLVLYFTNTTSISVIPKGDVYVNMQLFAPEGVLVSGVDIYVDGIYAGSTDLLGRATLTLTPGVYNVLLKGNNSNTSIGFMLGVIKNKTYNVPYYASFKGSYHNTANINGYGIYNSKLWVSETSETNVDENVCDMCALKAYMVGTIQAERCRLCSMNENTLFYASLFSYKFAEIKNIIDACEVPNLPPTNTPSLSHAVVSSYGINYVVLPQGGVEGLIEDIIKPYLPNLPCQDLIFNFDESKDNECSLYSCLEDLTPLSEIPFSCECYRICAVEGPSAILETYVKCVEEEMKKSS